MGDGGPRGRGWKAQGTGRGGEGTGWKACLRTAVLPPVSACWNQRQNPPRHAQAPAAGSVLPPPRPGRESGTSARLYGTGNNWGGTTGDTGRGGEAGQPDPAAVCVWGGVSRRSMPPRVAAGHDGIAAGGLPRLREWKTRPNSLWSTNRLQNTRPQPKLPPPHPSRCHPSGLQGWHPLVTSSVQGAGCLLARGTKPGQAGSPRPRWCPCLAGAGFLWPLKAS